MWWIFENLFDGGPEAGSIWSSRPLHIPSGKGDFVFQQGQRFQNRGFLFPAARAATTDRGIDPADSDVGKVGRCGQNLAEAGSAAFDLDAHFLDAERGVAPHEGAVEEENKLYSLNLIEDARRGEIAELRVDAVVVESMTDDELPSGLAVIVCLNVSRES